MGEPSLARFVTKGFLLLWFGLSLIAALIAYQLSVALIIFLLLMLVILFFKTDRKS